MSKLGKDHWVEAKRVSKYLCGTNTYGLCYQGRLGLDKELDIHGFVDVEWDGDMDRNDLQVGMYLTYLEEQLVR
jgi:hypothetical protein